MADGARLPGVDDDPEDDVPIVLHVDADCFYAACERLREPELIGEPVVVGMGYEPGDDGGAVATASYEARAFGVESAMGIGEALEKLPRRVDAEDDPEIELEASGHYRPVEMAFYESVSEDVRAILHDCADVVREVSVDEAYLDVTERTAWPVAEGFARHVKERIVDEVGITVSVGVAPSMSAAKIASDFEKPDGLTVVEPGAVQDFLAPLDVAELHGVGPVTARALRDIGLETAGDVAATDPGPLIERFGERGRELYDRARGDDDRRVTPRGLPKSFSRESAFGEPVTSWEKKHERLGTLASAVAERARREGALYRTVGVKAVVPPYDVNTRERSLSGPVDDADLVCDIATDLFAEFADEPVRKLGVRVANLDFDAPDQTALSGFETDESSTESDRGLRTESGRGSSTESDRESTTEFDDESTTDSEGESTASTVSSTPSRPRQDDGHRSAEATGLARFTTSAPSDGGSDEFSDGPEATDPGPLAEPPDSDDVYREPIQWTLSSVKSRSTVSDGDGNRAAADRKNDTASAGSTTAEDERSNERIVTTEDDGFVQTTLSAFRP